MIVSISTPTTLERTNSPIDSSETTLPFISVPDRFELNKGDQYHLVKAERSGLIFLNPRPSEHEIGKHYEALDYDPFITLKKKVAFQDHIYKFIRRTITLRSKSLRVLNRAKFVSGGHYKVLDIGCATGDFLIEFSRHTLSRIKDIKLDLYGIEISEKAVQFAIEENELFAKQGELLTVDFGVTFDLVSMWHVLEHIHRLNETLEKLHHILKPLGLLAIAMPNPNSWDALHYKKHWVGYDAPRHLYHFTPKAFDALLKKHGFKIIVIEPLPLDSYYNALLSEQLSVSAGNEKTQLQVWINAIIKGSIAASQNVESSSSLLYFIQKN